MKHYDDTKLQLLRERATANLPRLDSLQQWIQSRKASGEDERRAFIVEFAGMPKAGKSSAIKTIRQYFSSGSKIRVKEVPGKVTRAYRLHTPAEGVSLRTPGLLKQNLLDFNSWAGAYALQELLQAGHDNYHDLVLLDRGPWDAGCWLEYVKKSQLPKSIDKKEADKIIGFFQSPHWMTRADLHVVLVLDPVEAAKRESSERLIAHHGPVSDTSLMSAMRDIYEKKFPELQSVKAANCPHVKNAGAVLIDTTSLSDLEVASQIIEHAFSVLELKLAARAVLTVEQVWAGMKPFVTRTARPAEVRLVEEYIPKFVERANILPVSARIGVLDGLRDRYFPMSEEVDLFSNRYEASQIISDLETILAESEKL
jgi:hypothetical protein